MSPYALLGLSVLFEVFGTLLTTLVGIIVWDDPFSIIVGIGMIAVVAGIALLSKGTQEAEEAVAEATATEATATEATAQS